MAVSAYTPIAQSQITDFYAPLPFQEMAWLGQQKQARYDEFAKEANSAVTGLESIDVPANTKDYNYLQKELYPKLEDLKNRYASQDLGDAMVQRQFQNDLRGIVNKSKLQSIMQSASNIKEYKAMRDKLIQEGKYSELDQPSNVPWEGWDSSNGVFNATPVSYHDVNPMLEGFYKDLKPSLKRQLYPGFYVKGVDQGDIERISNQNADTLVSSDEGRNSINRYARSLGINPDSLSYKDRMGIAKDLIKSYGQSKIQSDVTGSLELENTLLKKSMEDKEASQTRSPYLDNITTAYLNGIRRGDGVSSNHVNKSYLDGAYGKVNDDGTYNITSSGNLKVSPAIVDPDAPKIAAKMDIINANDKVKKYENKLDDLDKGEYQLPWDKYLDPTSVENPVRNKVRKDKGIDELIKDVNRDFHTNIATESGLQSFLATERAKQYGLAKNSGLNLNSTEEIEKVRNQYATSATMGLILQNVTGSYKYKPYTDKDNYYIIGKGNDKPTQYTNGDIELNESQAKDLAKKASITGFWGGGNIDRLIDKGVLKKGGTDKNGNQMYYLTAMVPVNDDFTTKMSVDGRVMEETGAPMNAATYQALYQIHNEPDAVMQNILLKSAEQQAQSKK